MSVEFKSPNQCPQVGRAALSHDRKGPYSRRSIRISDADEKTVSIASSSLRGSSSTHILYDEGRFSPRCTFSQIKPILARGGDPVSEEEVQRIALLHEHLPDLKRALDSFEVLRRDTDRLLQIDADSPFQKIQLLSGDEWISCYDLSSSDFRFLIHSVSLDNQEINHVFKSRLKSGFLCASLVSEACPFFYKQDRSYALVLSADPGLVVSTNRQDWFTPDDSRDPFLAGFYRSYYRLQLLTAYIDKLYRDSGAQPVSAENRFLSLGAEEENGVNESGLDEKEEKVLQLLEEPGLSKIKIEEARSCLSSRVSSRSSEILSELSLCEEALEEFAKSPFYHRYLQPVVEIEELIRLTPFQKRHICNRQGMRPYNEINLDLGIVRKREEGALQLRGILIQREAFRKDPSEFLPVLLDARKNRIPILVCSEKEMDAAAVRRHFLKAASRLDFETVGELSSHPAIDEDLIGRALIFAVEGLSIPLVERIGNTHLEVPEPYLTQALDAAIRVQWIPMIEAILDLGGPLIFQKAAESLSSFETDMAGEFALCLAKRNVPLPAAYIRLAVKNAIQMNAITDVREIYINYCEQIPDNQWDQVWAELMDLFPSSLSGLLPLDKSIWAFDYLLEKRAFQAIGYFLKDRRFTEQISEEQLRKAIVLAIQERFPEEIIFQMISASPQKELELIRMAVRAAQVLGKMEIVKKLNELLLLRRRG